MNSSINPFTRGISGVTKGPRDLSVPLETPAGQEGIYQLGAPFQLSDTQAGMFCNIRRASVHANDLEMGSDLVMFDDPDAISSDNAITLIRGEEMDHPETGEPMILSTYPFVGGFVPVGARCDDRSPHPHAGSGFAVCTQRGYPVDARGTSWALDQPFERWRLQEYSYDGATFRITRDDVIGITGLIPGRMFSHFGSGNAIPDGTDLIAAVGVQAESPQHGDQAGLVRWRRDPEGCWQVVEFHPVADALGVCEPTLVRDIDGALLLAARGSFETGDNQAFLVWRSEDGGSTWEKMIHERGVRNSAPVTLNRAADGTPYLAANPHYLPSGQLFQHRELLALWPLAPDRRSVLPPIIIRDSADFGPGPYSHPWWLDHPLGCTLRLAGGVLRHLLAYRVLGNHEAVYDAAPAPQTGCYVEEVFSVNEPLGIWRF
jgi:hypothetical protein